MTPHRQVNVDIWVVRVTRTSRLLAGSDLVPSLHNTRLPQLTGLGSGRSTSGCGVRHVVHFASQCASKIAHIGVGRLVCSVPPLRSEIGVVPRDPGWLKQIALDANIKKLGLRPFLRLAC